MFSQRQTDSYGLVGTNARNSAANSDEQRNSNYSITNVSQTGMDKFEHTLKLDQVLAPLQSLNKKTNSFSEDPADYLISSNSNSKNLLRVSGDDMVEMNAKEVSDTYFFRFYDMPFDLKNSFREYMDTQLNEAKTQVTSAQCSPISGDIEPSCDEKMDKL